MEFVPVKTARPPPVSSHPQQPRSLAVAGIRTQKQAAQEAKRLGECVKLTDKPPPEQAASSRLRQARHPTSDPTSNGIESGVCKTDLTSPHPPQAPNPEQCDHHPLLSNPPHHTPPSPPECSHLGNCNSLSAPSYLLPRPPPGQSLHKENPIEPLPGFLTSLRFLRG